MVAEAAVFDRDEGVPDIGGKLAHRDFFARGQAAAGDHASFGIQHRNVVSGLIGEKVARIGQIGEPVGEHDPAGEKHPEGGNDQRDTALRAETFFFGSFGRIGCLGRMKARSAQWVALRFVHRRVFTRHRIALLPL